VCSNAQLATIAKLRPQTVDELMKIKGFSEQKTARHGGDIIALLNSVG
jgi:ribonuclease D